MSLITVIALTLVGCGAKRKDEEVSADRFQKIYREVGTDTDKKRVEYVGQMDGVVELNVTLRDWADEWVIQRFWIEAADLPPSFYSSLPAELNLDR